MNDAATPGARQRVLFFDDRHYAAQGAQRVLTQIAQFAQEAGHEVTVASTRPGKFLELAEERGLPTLALGTPKDLDQWGGILSGAGASRLKLMLALAWQNIRIAKFVHQENYDIVWAAAMRPALSLVLTSVAGRAKVVWHVMSDAHFAGFNELASLAASRIVLIADSLRPTIGRFRDWRRVRLRTTTLPPGLAPASTLQTTRQSMIEELQLPDSSLNKVWITSIGGFVPEKGHLDVVRALNLLPPELQGEIVLLLGGPPGNEEYAEQVAAERGESRAQVVIRGWVHDADRWMRACDIFVLASRREGVPLVLLEAMQRGVTSVSYCVGATPELIDHGRTGLLVEQGSIADLADALGSIVGDPARRKTFARKAQGFVEERHSRAAMRQHFNDIIIDLSHGRGVNERL